ncbi:hypothetical protein B4135_1275 [Caldibacillus debilis]|uniref:Uncharacterized protein n=1 Tax=Caldibacillus debilis TaxID=301148 RepID=A0A150MDU5_9BACI|nr:hypothetical protein B4135_1275 [Caldibacillus debilis]
MLAAQPKYPFEISHIILSLALPREPVRKTRNLSKRALIPANEMQEHPGYSFRNKNPAGPAR